jgi:uncharacterized phage infection (PIP) family protein YhgE
MTHEHSVTFWGRRRFVITVNIPQLDTLGDKIMANLSNISSALDSLSATLDSELTEIHDALANMQGPTQEEIDAVAQRVADLRDRIANIIP